MMMKKQFLRPPPTAAVKKQKLRKEAEDEAKARQEAEVGYDTKIEAEEITDEIRIFTYGNVGLSVLTMFTNTVNFFFIRKKFVTSFVNQILQFDSLLTAACQIGYIGILLSSISDAPNAYICNVASFFVAFSIAHFFLTNLLIVLGR